MSQVLEREAVEGQPSSSRAASVSSAAVSSAKKPNGGSKPKKGSKAAKRAHALRVHRVVRWAIQLAFFALAPSVFSAAFNGIKYVAGQIGLMQAVEPTSFVVLLLGVLLFTVVFGRFFCGYACAFGSLGDALYELTAFIRAKCFGKKKKHGYPEIWVHRLQKVKYLVLALLLLSCLTGMYSRLQGMSPWDVFSMLTTGRLPKSTYIVGTILLILIMIGMCTQERFFCQFLCPMGAVFAILPIFPGALFKRNRPNCAPKCTLCKKRCPAHLDIDGDTAHSGECICCHACTAVCPRKNIHLGEVNAEKIITK